MIALEEGGVIAGRYRLERELARGGMGAVWIAQHMQLDVPVAVKFMDPVYAASAEARARFEREAKAAAKLKSPHVVQVHDYGVENGMPFIVMELLQGEDLGVRLKGGGALRLGATAIIIMQVAKALRRAHDAGIVHPSVKPGNIFIALHEDEEIVKVLDFGIAKASDATKVGESTKTGTLMGSPHYMSPEQARGSKQLDWRSDIWSLGVIVFRMITGRLPFPGDEIGEVIMAICADPIPVPSEVAPHLGPEVDRFFERALARDVSRRFQSVRELAEALIALASAETGSNPNARWSLPFLSAGETTDPHRIEVTPGLGQRTPAEIARSSAATVAGVETVRKDGDGPTPAPTKSPSGTLASAQTPGRATPGRAPSVAVVSAPPRNIVATGIASPSLRASSVAATSIAAASVATPSSVPIHDAPSVEIPSIEIPSEVLPSGASGEPASEGIAPGSAEIPSRKASPPSAAPASVASAVPASVLAAQVPNGTLAGTGNTFAELPKRGPSPMMLAAMALGFALVVGGFMLLRSPAPGTTNAAGQPTNAAAIAATAPAATAPAATAAPSATTSASAAAPDPTAVSSAPQHAATAPSSTARKVPVPRPVATGTAPAGKPKSSVLGF